MKALKTLILLVTTRPSHIALLLALIIGFAGSAFAQTIAPTLIIVPNPPRKLSDWRTNRDAVQLIINNPQGPVRIKVAAELYLNGSLVAATKRELMPEINIQNGPNILFGSDIVNEQSFSAVSDVKYSTLRTGILPEGNYNLCLELFIGPEYITSVKVDCKRFVITQYLLPQLVLPENEKEFVVSMEKLITFRWTSVIPTPSLPMVYRLRAVEVLPGQTSQQAFAVNPPLFERKVPNMLQLLWPTEINLPPTGITIAWSIRPEDLSGVPYVTPESYAPPFTLKIIPSNEKCLALFENLKFKIKTLLALEEHFWHEYDIVERAEQLQEEAEDRGDAYEAEHWQTKRVVSTQSLDSARERYEAAYTAYEEALSRYKDCSQKPE